MYLWYNVYMIQICGKCKKGFPLTSDYWHKNKWRKSGYRRICKPCAIILSKEHNKTYQRKTYAKQYYQNHNFNNLRDNLRRRLSNAQQRCTNSKAKSYKWYGQRGIKCLFTSFEQFYNHVVDDLGIKNLEQLKGLQLDRINNDGHYEPGNIRFVTQKVNLNNRRYLN